eukprot:3726754-Rhodomonas_salina.3
MLTWYTPSLKGGDFRRRGPGSTIPYVSIGHGVARDKGDQNWHRAREFSSWKPNVSPEIRNRSRRAATVAPYGGALGAW